MKITILIEPESDSPSDECLPLRLSLVRMFTLMGFKVKVDGLIQTWTKMIATGKPTKAEVDNAML